MPEHVNTTPLGTLDYSNSKADDRQTMVKLENVSMVFNMANEQLNSLKEYAIALARRELNFKEFRALNDISFEVKKGDVFGILGTNGSGKSTLLKIIAGVLEPTEGKCTVNGTIAPLIELGAGFDMELTARENIFLNGSLLGYSKKFIESNFDDIVEFSEIEQFLDMPMKNYSSGMVARIAFAIATVIVPDILIVDEVLSVGDFMFQKKCEDRIKSLINEHNVTVLIVSHSNDQIERLCNKAIWIEKSRTRLMGDAADVCRIYGGLGGRQGTPESEQRVFQALKDIRAESVKPLSVTGSDPCETSVQLAITAWGQESKLDAVVVISGATHINALLASGIAGAYNAPILSVKPDGLPLAVEHYLLRTTPKTILYIDCGESALRALEQMKHLPWNPEIIDLSGPGHVFAYSLSILDFGIKNHLWGREMAFVEHDDLLESLAFASYATRTRCPIICMRKAYENIGVASIIETLEKHNPEKIFTLNRPFGKMMDIRFETIAAEWVSLAEAESKFARCMSITRYIQECSSSLDALCLASLSSSQVAHLFGIGAFANKTNGLILMEDSTDLDSTASCLDFIADKRGQIKNLLLVGSDNAFSSLDELLFAGELR